MDYSCGFKVAKSNLYSCLSCDECVRHTCVVRGAGRWDVARANWSVRVSAVLGPAATGQVREGESSGKRRPGIVFPFPSSDPLFVEIRVNVLSWFCFGRLASGNPCGGSSAAHVQGSRQFKNVVKGRDWDGFGAGLLTPSPARARPPGAVLHLRLGRRPIPSLAPMFPLRLRRG